MKTRIFLSLFAITLSATAASTGTWSASGGVNATIDGWNVTTNGTGNTGSFQGNSAANGATDVSSITGNPAWGFFANGGGQLNAAYTLNGGALAVGQTLSINFDNGFIDTGKQVGIDFRMGSTTGISIFFTGGQANYEIFHSGGLTNSGVGFTDDGFTIQVKLTGTNTFDLTFDTYTLSGTLGNAATGIDNIQLFNNDAGNGSSNDLFANQIMVIPEPHTTVLALATTGFLFRRRRPC